MQLVPDYGRAYLAHSASSDGTASLPEISISLQATPAPL